jgi:predicted transcriptional regulator
MVTQLQLSDDLIKRFDALARYAGESREHMMRVALEDYVARMDEEDATVAAAIAQAERGDLLDAEIVRAEAEAMLLARGVTPEQMAAIRAEVRSEMEAAYGVSLCE